MVDGKKAQRMFIEKKRRLDKQKMGPFVCTNVRMLKIIPVAMITFRELSSRLISCGQILCTLRIVPIRLVNGTNRNRLYWVPCNITVRLVVAYTHTHTHVPVNFVQAASREPFTVCHLHRTKRTPNTRKKARAVVDTIRTSFSSVTIHLKNFAWNGKLN